MIFRKEFWSEIVGDQLAKSTDPLRLRKRILQIGVPTREWELAFQEMTKPLVVKVNAFRRRSLAYHVDFLVVHHWPGDLSGPSP